MVRNLILSGFIILSGAVASFLILGVDIAHAQGLVPDCNFNITSNEPFGCGACELVELAHNIINFFIYLAIVIATLLFMWAGILYVTSGPNPDNIKKAHKIFFNVLIGLVIVLASWLIVDTLIRVIVKDVPRDSIAPWAAVLCDRRAEAPDIGTRPGNGSVVIPPPGVTTPITNEQRILDAQVRERLEFNNVGVNKPVCESNQSTNCTSVWNLRENTIQYAIRVSQECECRVTLTGAGEVLPHRTGPFSHGEGYKLDFGRNSNPELFAWLEAGNEFPSGANATLENRGTSNEHWDLCVGCP